MLEIVTVATGLSEDSTTSRLADRLAAATASAAGGDQDVQVTAINLRTLGRDLVSMTVTGMPSPQLEEAFAAVGRAAALITVAPVYKTQPVGLHTLFFQLLDDAALAGVPVLIGSTGGTARHSLAAEATLRPLLAYLKAIVLPTTVFAATDDWGADTAGHSGGTAPLQTRIDSAAAELAGVLSSGYPSAPTGGAAADHLQPAGTTTAVRRAPETNSQDAAGGGHDERIHRADAFDPSGATLFAQMLNS